jgi:hypothetical protein
MSFHTTITSAEPWRLTQLHNAYNFLKTARSELERVLPTMNVSSTSLRSETTPNTPRDVNDTVPHHYLKAARQLIERIATWIKYAQDQITLPSRTTFLNSLYTRFVHFSFFLFDFIRSHYKVRSLFFRLFLLNCPKN